MRGTFDLATPDDLLHKAELDLQKLRDDPRCPFLAFNFVVTISHVADWYCEGCNKAASSLSDNSEDLRVLRELANGAKHWKLDKGTKWVNYTHATSTVTMVTSGHASRSAAGDPPLSVSGEQYAMSLQDGRDVMLIDVGERAIKWWRQKLPRP